MSFRFRTALPLALVTVAALAACDPAGTEPRAGSSVAAPPSAAAPASTAPAGPSNDDVCKAVNLALIDGSVEIADNAVKSIDERWTTKEVNDHLRASFGAMAKKVAAEGAGVTDPELKAAVEEAAAELAVGAKAKDPGKFLDKDFQTLAKSMDKSCGA